MKLFLGLILTLALILTACGGATSSAVLDGGKMKTATIETNKGTIKVELYTEKAPITTKNFIDLANNKFYDGLTYHRYVPGFVIQGGDPEGTGTGGSENSIPLEVSDELKHTKGALAMARSQDPDSARSQYYITLEEQSFLDGKYAVFGQVIEGMEVALELREGDVMNKITIN
tara:strand:+ start:19405 stop:19923 length:519 start_codon:yes stop_codon:yes gene_type:complete